MQEPSENPQGTQPARTNTLWSLSRASSFLNIPNFSQYALPQLQFSTLSDDLRNSNVEYFDSSSDEISLPDRSSSLGEDLGDLPTYPEEDSRWIPLPLRHRGSTLHWQSVPRRKPVGSATANRSISKTSLRRQYSSRDPDLLTWNGSDDPRNPLNWPKRKKWISTILVSSFTFISPLASTMVAPALPDIADQFNIKSDIEEALVMSIFLLAYAVGPFVIGPLSEIYGRVVVLQSANLVYLIFNTACGFAKTKEQMMAFRFLSGLGGSAPQAIGGGVLGDCWAKEERGSALAMYSLAPFIGPAVGPIAGGYITLHTTWRWIFWSSSIADTLIQILAFLFLEETYHPAILGKVCKQLKKETGNTRLHTKWQTPDKTFGQIFRKAMVRPFLMLCTQPALQAMSIYRAYGYGVMYLVLSTFPQVFREQYNQDIGTASLHYLSLGIGFVLGLQFSKRLQDAVYKYLKTNAVDPCDSPWATMRSLMKRYRSVPDAEGHECSSMDFHPSTPLTSSRALNLAPPKRVYTSNSVPSDGLPEHRLPLCLPFGFIIPVGLLMYGLSAAAKTHWIVPDIGAAIFAVGLIITFNCAQAYVVDTYTNEKEGIYHAASATGAAAFVRTMAGFSFPLFAPRLYDKFGIGGGNGLLAGIALAVGLAAPLILWRYGVKLRRWGYSKA